MFSYLHCVICSFLLLVLKKLYLFYSILFFFFVKTSLCKMTVLLYLPAASSLQQGLITS